MTIVEITQNVEKLQLHELKTMRSLLNDIIDERLCELRKQLKQKIKVGSVISIPSKFADETFLVVVINPKNVLCHPYRNDEIDFTKKAKVAITLVRHEYDVEYGVDAERVGE